MALTGFRNISNISDKRLSGHLNQTKSQYVYHEVDIKTITMSIYHGDCGIHIKA